MPPRRLQTLLFLALGACTPTETPERSDTDLDTDAPPTTGIDSGTSSPVGTGVGLSAEHPYDQGIETHPDVLFVADFEELDWADAWQEIARPACKENEEAPEIVHAGCAPRWDHVFSGDRHQRRQRPSLGGGGLVHLPHAPTGTASSACSWTTCSSSRPRAWS
jgi:hypothetical protein